MLSLLSFSSYNSDTLQLNAQVAGLQADSLALEDQVDGLQADSLALEVQVYYKQIL